MATKFLSLSIAPKDVKKRTVFTHELHESFEWLSAYCEPDEFINVLHIGKINDKESLFKCWDNDINSFTLYRGILGEEEYTSL